MTMSTLRPVCPICLAGDWQADCAACAGRGEVAAIPYAKHRWDEIVPGLWLGGHQCQQGLVYPRDRFDTVVSMTLPLPERFEPAFGVEHVVLRIRDEGCIVADVAPQLDRLAQGILHRLDEGNEVLVRCWAGLNRAGLVTGMVLILQGWEPDDAIDLIRERRSPFALYNQDFVTHLRSFAGCTSIA